MKVLIIKSAVNKLKDKVESNKNKLIETIKDLEELKGNNLTQQVYMTNCYVKSIKDLEDNYNNKRIAIELNHVTLAALLHEKINKLIVQN